MEKREMEHKHATIQQRVSYQPTFTLNTSAAVTTVTTACNTVVKKNDAAEKWLSPFLYMHRPPSWCFHMK